MSHPIYTDFYSLLGLLGMLLIVIAYYLNIVGKLKTKSLSYSLINLVGAALLLISLCVHFNLGSFLIEIFWVIISVVGIWRCQQEITSPPTPSSRI